MHRRNNLGSRFFIGVGLIVAICLLGALYSKVTGNPSPVTSVVGFVTSPVQKLFSGIGGFFGNGIAYFTDFDDLKAENEELKKQIRDMEQTVRDAQLAIDENTRLRQQLGQPKTTRNLSTITAEVIARNPGDWATTLTLDKGSSHDVEKDDLVITEDGMVGYVSSVASNYCEVITVVDIEMQCGALITRTRESAIAEGNYDLMNDNLLRLSYLKEGADIITGDTVETSGRGGVFPKGIMIGTVENVLPEENGISYYAELKPFVDVDTVTSVSIVTDFTDSSDPSDTVGTAPSDSNDANDAGSDNSDSDENDENSDGDSDSSSDDENSYDEDNSDDSSSDSENNSDDSGSSDDDSSDENYDDANYDDENYDDENYDEDTE